MSISFWIGTKELLCTTSNGTQWFTCTCMCLDTELLRVEWDTWTSAQSYIDFCIIFQHPDRAKNISFIPYQQGKLPPTFMWQLVTFSMGLLQLTPSTIITIIITEASCADYGFISRACRISSSPIPFFVFSYIFFFFLPCSKFPYPPSISVIPTFCK